VNFGVSGYGTLQSLIQLEQSLTQKAFPSLVILAYASFHDVRNTLSYQRIRNIDRGNFLGPVSHPYARWDPEIEDISISHSGTTFYHKWPLVSHSALLHQIQLSVEKILDKSLNSQKVTQQLLIRMKNLCKSNKAKFLVANIFVDSTVVASMKAFCQTNQIEFLDISVDLSQEGMNNLPYDGHPSPLANQHYAHKLFKYLNRD